MANTSFDAQLNVVASDPDILRRTPIQALSVDSNILRLNKANDTSILTLLEQARAGKSITLYKTPSKDDLDAVLIGVANGHNAFGFNLELYAIYSKSRVHFVHFFQEGATISESPVRVGGG